jgi:hypothetical protein
VAYPSGAPIRWVHSWVESDKRQKRDRKRQR